MTVRMVIIAAVALSLSNGAFAADPTKVDQRDTAASSPAAKELVLASAEVKPATDESAQAPAPAKRRTARVTTCRCGDPQQPQSEQQ